MAYGIQWSKLGETDMIVLEINQQQGGWWSNGSNHEWGQGLTKASHKKDMQDRVDPDDEQANVDKYPLGMSDDEQSDNDLFDGGEVEV